MNDSGILTQDEANYLLNMLKKSLSNEIAFPKQNSSTEFDVQGNTKQNLFTISISRGKIKRTKYSLGARIKKNGTMLLELHLNPGNTHINPDGEKIVGSHWHIYKEGYGHKFAYPADNIDSDNFIENTLSFFDRFNIIEKPIINHQLELLQ